MPDEAEPFGLVFWRALEREIADRAAKKQPLPTKEERMKLCTELHERDLERRLAIAVRASAPAAGLFGESVAPGLTKARKSKPADDESWLRELEADPLYIGLNIRQQLGMCQRWCKNHSAQPTRKRFTNWLNKALSDKPILVSGVGEPRTSDSASLGALQHQQKQIENEMESILYPGGAAFKTIPTGEKLVRFEELKRQREGIKTRIERFSSQH